MDKTLVCSYAKEIALRLKEPRKYGEVSVMIGAGFSKNAKSKGVIAVQPPNWTQLADKMYCELYPECEDMGKEQKKEWDNQRIIKTSGKNVTKLAEEYIVNFDRNKMNRLIEEAIADDFFLPGELHKKLLKLAWGDIFTTNYDTLLERAADLIFREKNYEIIYSQNDIPGSIRPRIIKLHGSIPQVKPYIICDEDYRTYPIKYAAMVNTVQQAMLETRLCLIGFSGDDPNFQNWLGWLRDNMGDCCPKIYLIGIYDNLSEPERKLLENKNIIIIDLSVLVKKDEENKHYEAISRFLDLLEQYQEEKDLYLDRPFPKANDLWNPKDVNGYIKKIENYSFLVVKWMQPYILLPEEIRKNYDNYFLDHFSILLNVCKGLDSIAAIANVIKILRKCSVVLEDRNAACMEMICKNYCNISDVTNKEVEAFIEIYLYLAEMYRIDSKKEEYIRIISTLEQLVAKVTWYKNDLLIEQIKYEIESFRYNKAKELTAEIEESSFEYKVKKAGFYKQLSENKISDKILSECSAELAQMKISEDIYASYLGYINLCHRANNVNICEDYSDMNCYNNEFNVRHIIVAKRDEVSRSLFSKDCKEEERVLPFNLNAGKKVVYALGQSETYKKSFVFLLSLDRLCLPSFSDLAVLYPRVISEVIGSSKSACWKLSLAVRTNNEKVIEQIFTRKVLESLEGNDINCMFESLISLVELYEMNSYFYKEYLVSKKNILNILSRLVVFLPDVKIVEYLKILCKISTIEDNIIVQDINKMIERIHTRFNSVIASLCQDIIFIDFGKQYHMASYFNFPFKIDEDNFKKYYVYAIELTKSENIINRDCGIAQLLVLWKNARLEEYEKEIETALWEDIEDMFPRTELFYHFVWESLPHPKSVIFSNLYYQYLSKDRYIVSATDFGRIGRRDYLNSVRSYFDFYYSVSGISARKLEKIVMDEGLSAFMLDTAYNFIEHEKGLLERESILGENQDVKIAFKYIGQLVAMVYTEGMKAGYGAVLSPKVNAIFRILSMYHIEREAISIAVAIGEGKYGLCMEIFENTILSKNMKSYSSAFTGIKCLLFYFEQQKNQDSAIDKFWERFMNAIKYLDIEYAKAVWVEFTSLLMRDYFVDVNKQEYVASAVEKCIELYINPAQMGERYYLDGLYNCIYALHNYYEYVLESDVEISQMLMNCVLKAKSIENLEIKNIWI